LVYCCIFTTVKGTRKIKFKDMEKAKFKKGQKVRYAGQEGYVRSVRVHYDGTIYYGVKYGGIFYAQSLTKHDPIEAI
jgi:hypothetical protein